MDIHRLDPAVQQYFTAALTESSHRTYKSAERRYYDFCTNFSLTPFPTTENVLCYFVACLGQQGLAHSTIKTYLSGIRQVQIALGFPDVDHQAMPRLRQVLKGVQMTRGKEGRAPKPRLPITPSVLRKMKEVWARQGDSYVNIMLWAAAATTFFSFCRSGEMVVEKEDAYDPASHLSYRDIAVDNPKKPTMIALTLRQSKTDQARKGVKVVIGSTGDDICPVSALLRYLQARGKHPGPLFMEENGQPLTKAKFISGIRAALTEARLPAKDYAGHSFRIGAATTAAAAGLEDSLIRTLGRWKSSSYLLYIRIDPRQLAAVSSSLANCSI